MIQSEIYQKICPRLKLSPYQIFSGRNGGGKLLPEFMDEPSTFPMTCLGDIVQPTDVEPLHLELHSFENEVDDIRLRVFQIHDSTRQQCRTRHENELGVEEIQHGPGDFVSFSIRDGFKTRNKFKLH